MSIDLNIDTTFLGNSDTPDSYAGNAGRIVTVNSDENGLEFLDPENVDNPDGALFFADLATVARLNNCTYNNGTGGVGATLTGSANGSLGEFGLTVIDGVIPQLSQVILIKNQTPASQNGLYQVTQIGSISTPFILTRVDGYNETSEIYPSVVLINTGDSNANKYFNQTTVDPVIGTNNITYGIATSPAVVFPIVYIDTYTDDVINGDYLDGTLYPSQPGNRATITNTVNGALGTINGVLMTSGLKILLNGQENARENGDYIVTNPGSANSKYKLTRISYNATNLNYKNKKWIVNNDNSIFYGSEYTLSASTPIILSSLVGISEMLFVKSNNVGLRDLVGSVELSNSNQTSFFGIANAGITQNTKGNITLQVRDTENNIIGSITIDNTTGNINIDGKETGDITIYVNDGNHGIELNEEYVSLLGLGGSFTVNESGLILSVSGFGKNIIIPSIQEYSDDAEADADTNLQQNALYQLVGDRSIYRKP